MGKKIDWVLGKLGLMTKATLADNVNKAKEDGMAEERTWHVHGEGKNAVTALQLVGEEIPQDFSYLYEAVEGLPSVKRKKVKKEIDRALEAFAGGFTNTSIFAEEQDVEVLKQMQLAVHNKYYTDPHCRSIIDNWTNYTIGGGIKIAVDNEKVLEALNDFRQRNKMPLREKELIRHTYKEGELFIAYYVNTRNGLTQIRRIRPLEIADIETHPNDIEVMFAYHQEYEYSPSGTDQSYKVDKWFRDFMFKHNRGRKGSKKQTAPSPVVQFIKFGLDTEIRGRVPLQPVLRFLKYYEDWLIDRIRLNHERAKVVWIKEIKGRQFETTNRIRRAPAGGVMLVETDNVKYRIEKAQINADDAKDDGLAILYTIGAGTGIPIHILNQRSDQEVYASIRKADTPFSQYIRAQQEFFAEHFELMYRFVLEKLVEAGTLQKTVKVPEYSQEALEKVMTKVNQMVVEGIDREKIIEEVKKDLKPKTKMKKVATVKVPLALEFPEIIREDPKAQAEVMKIHKEIGIVSAATLSAHAGYNWKQELTNIITEKALHDELYPEELAGPQGPQTPKKSDDTKKKIDTPKKKTSVKKDGKK